MSIRGLIDRAVGKIFDKRFFQTDGSGYVDTLNTLLEPTMDKLLKSYEDTVYACANLNAQAVGSTPLRLFVRTCVRQAKPKCLTKQLSIADTKRVKAAASIQGKFDIQDISEVTEHPVLRLLSETNKALAGSSIITLTDLYLELVGVAYWLVERHPTLNIPVKLLLLMSQHVHPKKLKDLDGKVSIVYEYGTGMTKKVFQAENLIIFRFPDMSNPYVGGRSPARAVYERVAIQSLQQSHMYNTLRKRARPDAILTPKERISEPQRRRMQKLINKRLTGAGSGGILVANNDYTLAPYSLSPKDLEGLAFHEISKTQIANAYGVPMSMLENKTVTRANAEAGQFQHSQLAVIPRLTLIVSSLTNQLAEQFDDRLFFWYDDPTPDDVLRSAKIRTMDLKSAVITINEIRETNGAQPVDWGDEPFVPATQSAFDLVNENTTKQTSSSLFGFN